MVESNKKHEKNQEIINVNSLEQLLNSGYPCTKKASAGYPIRVLRKNLSNYTDEGTALSTHSSIFTEQVLVWVHATVVLLRKTLQGTLDLSRSV
jgi:hypothetical protein